MASPKAKRRSFSASLAKMNPFSSSPSKASEQAEKPRLLNPNDEAMFRPSSASDSQASKRKASTEVIVGGNSAGMISAPVTSSSFIVGVAEDRNQRCRRTMEDTHSFVYNFGQVEGQGYAAIFDGHAGSQAAEYCGVQFHDVLADVILKNPGRKIPDLLDATFTYVDSELSRMTSKTSGCTAVVALMLYEDRSDSKTKSESLTGGSIEQKVSRESVTDEQSDLSRSETSPSDVLQSDVSSSSKKDRVLYTANVGDARIVLCRGGRAIRLSYDHKGSDEKEGQRVTQAGGFIVKNRVNGVLAVTRALGDSYMKDLISGHPYTTETVLQQEDEFIILACDGLWDVCTDQEAVDLVRDEREPTVASKKLVEHALSKFSTDNLTCMMIRTGSSVPDADTMTTPTIDGTRINIATETVEAGPERNLGKPSTSTIQEDAIEE